MLYLCTKFDAIRFKNGRIVPGRTQNISLVRPLFLVVALYERKVPFDDGCRWTSKMATTAAILNLVS